MQGITRIGQRGATSAAAAAARDAARFDRRAVSASAGLLAAIPVTAVLGGSIAAGDPVAGVTMGAGAMLVGVAWRVTGGRPPIVAMAIDALVMATATFVGCVTGNVPWLHLVLLCLWSTLGGLLVGVGNRGAIVGMQAIIAFVVFGRFSEPAPQALGLAAYVLAGGGAQVALLSVIRWPPPLRIQRQATARAYRELAKLAEGTGERSTLPAGNALDEARAALAAPALFGDPALMTLRSLVGEGHRLRVQLIALHSLAIRHRGGGAAGKTAPTDPAVRLLAMCASALSLAAAAIEGDGTAARRLEQDVAEFSRAVGRANSLSVQVGRRAAAMAGQLRAVATLAPAAGSGSGLRSRRPRPRTGDPLARVRAALAQVRANASLESPAGRHAVRLAVIVPVAELISRVLPLQRGYWMVVAAATVLRPEFGATFTRGTERAVGTCLGVALAGAIAILLHPAGGVIVVLVAILAWAAYSLFPASFATGFAFITALVVFLLNVLSPDSLGTASARLLDTLVGGSIGLLAYAVWPTWSYVPARQALADLVAAERAYLGGILAAVVSGRRAGEHRMRDLARRARMTRTAAEATVARSLTEPAARRIDTGEAQGTLAVSRRLMQAAHVLRLDVQEDRERTSQLRLARLAADVDRLLAIVESRFRDDYESGRRGALPDLRGDLTAFERESGDDAESAALLTGLDEIVDAANGLASTVGLDPAVDM